MLCFIAHQRLGGGANLSCTCIYLTLLHMVEHGHTLGSRLQLLLDNTCSENKCNEVIFLLAFLVATDVFEDASFFCMMKGHTYTTLDQSFNTMQMHLKQIGIYCISSLIHHIWKALAKYSCLKVRELHALWDWRAFFKPHIDKRLSGFATGQFGPGMHEFYLRKNVKGEVRLWLRASSQASDWLPEGDGYLIFSSIPTGEPPLAAPVQLEHQWGRIEFEATLRQWFRFMVVDSERTHTNIRKEWSSVLDALPPDNDINQLADDLKPQWQELPKHNDSSCEQQTGGVSMIEGVTSLLENPPINPVKGISLPVSDSLPPSPPTVSYMVQLIGRCWSYCCGCPA